MSPPQFRTRRKDGTFQLYEFEYRPRGRGLDGSYCRPYLLFVQYWGVNELVQARSSLQLTLSSCSGEVIISLLARILPEFINWGRQNGWRHDAARRFLCRPVRDSISLFASAAHSVCFLKHVLSGRNIRTSACPAGREVRHHPQRGRRPRVWGASRAE